MSPLRTRTSSVKALLVASALAMGATLGLGSTATAATQSWTLSPGTGASLQLAGDSATSTSIVTYSLGGLPRGGSLYLASSVRQNSCGSLFAQVRINPDGSLIPTLRSRVGSADTVLGSGTVTTVAGGDRVTVTTKLTGSGAGTLSGTVTTVSAGTGRSSTVQLASVTPPTTCGTTGISTAWGHLAGGATASAAVSVDGQAITGGSEQALAQPVQAAPPAQTTQTTTAISQQPSGTMLRNGDNTGIPADIKSLKTYTGPLRITTPGTRIDGAWIEGNVWILAPNVKITRSVIRGGTATGVQGVVTVAPEGAGFVLEDSEVFPGVADVRVDGIKGAGFTVRRSEVRGGVDNIKVHGDNVLIEDSYLHSTDYFTSDPFQNGGATHNDNIQVLGGNNITIRGNTMRQEPMENASLQVTQDHAALTNFSFTRNNVDGGTCSANFNHKKLTSLSGFTFSDNVFGTNTRYKQCALLTTDKVTVNNVRNTFTDGTAIRQRYM